MRSRPRAACLYLSLGLGLVIVAHNLTALVVMGLVLLGAAILYLPSALSGRHWLVGAGGVGRKCGRACE